MPYIVTREDKDLGLKLGQELKHEQGKLPTSLKFNASWKESEAKEEPEHKARKPKAKPE